jgi:hypothetical protein
MTNPKDQYRASSWRLGSQFRRYAAITFFGWLTAIAAPAFAQSACDQIKTALTNGQNAANNVISQSEASTHEATSAARQCLENIQNSMNKLIPGMPSISPADFTSLLNGMINRACQVVTTQIDSAGNVIQGTVSGVTNRVIGDVNSQVNNATGGNLGGNVISTGSTTPIISTGTASPTVTPSSTSSSSTSIWGKLTCAVTPGCKN